MARVLARRPVLLLPQPPAAADAGQRLDRRPDDRSARAVLARRPLPRRGRDDRGGRTGRAHPLHPSSAVAIREHAATTGCCSSGCSSRRRRPGSSRWPRSTAGRHRPPAPVSPLSVPGADVALTAMAEIVVDHRPVGRGTIRGSRRLEDLGFYVVDNLPTSLFPTIVDLAATPGRGIDRLALVSGRHHDGCCPTSLPCVPPAIGSPLVYLDASTRARTALRRDPPQHPFAAEAGGLLEGSNTSARAPATRSRRPRDRHLRAQRPPAQGATGRGFDEAAPRKMQVGRELRLQERTALDADIVMDVRFLPNPHWDECCDRSPATIRGCATTCSSAAATSGVPRSLRGDAARCSALPGGGAQLPHDRDRLHGRTSPLGGDRRGDASRLRAHGIAARTTHRDIAR